MNMAKDLKRFTMKLLELWLKSEGIKPEIGNNRVAFYANGNNSNRIISEQIKNKGFIICKNRFAQIASILQVKDEENTNIPIVSSIEIVRGLKGERC